MEVRPTSLMFLLTPTVTDWWPWLSFPCDWVCEIWWRSWLMRYIRMQEINFISSKRLVETNGRTDTTDGSSLPTNTNAFERHEWTCAYTTLEFQKGWLNSRKFKIHLLDWCISILSPLEQPLTETGLSVVQLSPPSPRRSCSSCSYRISCS